MQVRQEFCCKLLEYTVLHGGLIRLLLSRHLVLISLMFFKLMVIYSLRNSLILCPIKEDFFSNESLRGDSSAGLTRSSSACNAMVKQCLKVSCSFVGVLDLCLGHSCV